jgi:hypothetical protein
MFIFAAACCVKLLARVDVCMDYVRFQGSATARATGRVRCATAVQWGGRGRPVTLPSARRAVSCLQPRAPRQAAARAMRGTLATTAPNPSADRLALTAPVPPLTHVLAHLALPGCSVKRLYAWQGAGKALARASQVSASATPGGWGYCVTVLSVPPPVCREYVLRPPSSTNRP